MTVVEVTNIDAVVVVVKFQQTQCMAVFCMPL